MNGLDETRWTVFAALVDQLAPYLPVESVHAYRPDELALPAVYVDSPFGMRPADLVTIVAAVDIVIAVDGAEPAQLALLDTLQAAVWVAGETVGSATLATATVFYAGGPNVHAVTVNVDVDVDVRTLCPPELIISTN